jgi:hypothetical protein
MVIFGMCYRKSNSIFFVGYLSPTRRYDAKGKDAHRYECNGWTTGIQGDERKGQHEYVVQGDTAVQYQVNDILQVTGAFRECFEKRVLGRD